MELKVKKLNENAVMPSYGSEFSAGADLYSCSENIISLNPGETKFIGTGLSMAIPEGYAGLIYARSGIACKRGLAPANKVGVIDSDYRGEIIVAIHNHSNDVQTIEPKERIAQIIISKVESPKFIEADVLDDTDRGDGGFGHSGRK